VPNCAQACSSSPSICVLNPGPPQTEPQGVAGFLARWAGRHGMHLKFLSLAGAILYLILSYSSHTTIHTAREGCQAEERLRLCNCSGSFAALSARMTEHPRAGRLWSLGR
jgi:hypothetical protein